MRKHSLRRHSFIVSLAIVAFALGWFMSPMPPDYPVTIHAQGGVTSLGTSPTLVARFDATAQAANVASTLVFQTTTKGTYRATCYVEVTQAATTSSTMPSCNVLWTTADSGTAQTAGITATSAANTVGTNSTTTANSNAPVQVAAAGASVNVSTTGYASVGATAMQYAVHFKLEFLGS